LFAKSVTDGEVSKLPLYSGSTPVSSLLTPIAYCAAPIVFTSLLLPLSSEARYFSSSLCCSSKAHVY
jgi:hypothetical protein